MGVGDNHEVHDVSRCARNTTCNTHSSKDSIQCQPSLFRRCWQCQPRAPCQPQRAQRRTSFSRGRQRRPAGSETLSRPPACQTCRGRVVDVSWTSHSTSLSPSSDASQPDCNLGSVSLYLARSHRSSDVSDCAAAAPPAACAASPTPPSPSDVASRRANAANDAAT